jgi:hypothetical protein
MLQSPSGAELNEGPIGPIHLPPGAVENLRAGDVLHAEVAPSVSGWRILEIARVLPAGYGPTRLHYGSESDRSDNS